jgi:hypothetical protein
VVVLTFTSLVHCCQTFVRAGSWGLR